MTTSRQPRERKITSWEIERLVGERSTQRGTTRFVSYVIASHYNNHLGYAFPSRLQIAEITGMSESQVKRAIRSLRDAHEWEIEPGTGPTATRYRPGVVLLAGLSATAPALDAAETDPDFVPPMYTDDDVPPADDEALPTDPSPEKMDTRRRTPAQRAWVDRQRRNRAEQAEIRALHDRLVAERGDA